MKKSIYTRIESRNGKRPESSHIVVTGSEDASERMSLDILLDDPFQNNQGFSLAAIGQKIRTF